MILFKIEDHGCSRLVVYSHFLSKLKKSAPMICLYCRCILLRGVERLWSSLYDMLNQHYTVVGGRRNCRIAIGAYSNPMCYVNDTFRCIVVVDFDHIRSLDPPFLNRFEKQVLTYDDMLTDLQRKAVKSLKRWCEQMAGVSVESGNDVFKVSDLFAGYHEDTLPSLVLQHLNGSCSIDSDLVLTNQLDRYFASCFPFCNYFTKEEITST